MNPIPEFDLELLEAYLDDALSPGQVQHVAQRLLDEPELAVAMHDLRAQRTLRIAVWRSLDPGDHGALPIADQVARRVRRIELRRRVFRVARSGAAVAAAILVFGGGWFVGHSRSDPSAEEVPGAAAVAKASAVGANAAGGRFEVPLLDRAGHVIAVQKFAREDDARRFADDMLRYEARRRQVQNGGAVLVSDHF